MHAGILLGVLAYEVLCILGIGLYLQRRREGAAGEFLLASRDMSTPVVAITLALTVLGTPHIFGVFEMAYGIGAIAIWFPLAHVVLLVVASLTTGRWVRRLEVTTMPELLARMYGEVPRLLIACVMAGMVWGILTLESQGIGLVFSILTGITPQVGAVVGGLFGVLYVVLAGMKEVGWVNVINCVVMYAGIIVATVWLTFQLPGGWEGVGAFYATEPWKLSIFGTPDLLFTFALGTVLSVVFTQSVSQQLMQPAMSAESEQAIRRSLWISAPVNGLWGAFVVAIGLAARAHPEFGALGPKVAANAMLVELLPGWLVAWILATFLAAILSSFAMAVMAPATIFAVDLYKNLFHPTADEARITNVTRIAIVVLSVPAVLVAAYLPPVIQAINWLFAWLTPVFWLVVFGLFWKRSNVAATITLVVAWTLNSLWSFTPLASSLGMTGVPNVYVTLAVSLVVGGALTAALDGKPGLLREAAS
jgi:solute:Na+ symporter, SSS family